MRNYNNLFFSAWEVMHTGTILAQMRHQYLKSIYAPILVSICNTNNLEYNRPLTLLKCATKNLSSKNTKFKTKALTWCNSLGPSQVKAFYQNNNDHCSALPHPFAEPHRKDLLSAAGFVGIQGSPGPPDLSGTDTTLMSPSHFHFTVIGDIQPHSHRLLSKWIQLNTHW